jgi:hypothetical protein
VIKKTKRLEPPANVDGYFSITVSFYKLPYTMEGCGHWIILEIHHTYFLSYYDAIYYILKAQYMVLNRDPTLSHIILII